LWQALHTANAFSPAAGSAAIAGAAAAHKAVAAIITRSIMS
jgi:hypothetical protein